MKFLRFCPFYLYIPIWYPDFNDAKSLFPYGHEWWKRRIAWIKVTNPFSINHSIGSSECPGHRRPLRYKMAMKSGPVVFLNGRKKFPCNLLFNIRISIFVPFWKIHNLHTYIHTMMCIHTFMLFYCSWISGCEMSIASGTGFPWWSPISAHFWHPFPPPIVHVWRGRW